MTPRFFCGLVCSTMLAGTTAAGEPDLATPPAPLITDRPDQTESSAVVPPGLVQVEAGGFRVEDREERGTARSHSIGETLIRVGLGRDVELRAGFAGFRVVEEHTPEESDTREDGPGGAALGLKIGVLEERGARPLMALIAGTTLPGGARPFSSDSFDPFLRACASHGLSDRLSLAYNVGAAWQTAEDETGDEDTLSVLLGTVSLGFGATDRVGLFVELFGESGLSAEGALTAADGGATWLVLDNLQLDLSGGVGLSTSASDWFVGLGISFRLPR